MKKSYRKKILYEKYLEDTKEQLIEGQIKENIEKALPSEPESIVVKKEAAITGILHMAGYTIASVLRWGCYAMILILASIGATALANAPTRDALLSILAGL